MVAPSKGVLEEVKTILMKMVEDTTANESAIATMRSCVN
jgi:hypothetical protein